MKVCVVCAELKDTDCFYAYRGYVWSTCKACLKLRRKQRPRSEKERLRAATYYAEHKEAIGQRVRRWQDSNPGKERERKQRRRARLAGGGGSFSAAEWEALVAATGNKCLRCGATDALLSADHVVPVSKGGSSNIDNIQPLCKSCNSAKGTKSTDYRG